MSNSPPHLITPALRLDRLLALGRELVTIQRKLVALQEPEEGDIPWSLGCRAHARRMFRFTQMELSGEFPWLRVKTEGLSYFLYVDDVPVRVYRGDKEDPGPRHLRASLNEMLAQGRLQFYERELQEEARGWCWFMAIETDAEGASMGVWMLQANEEGEIRHSWRVPVDEPVRALAGLRGEEVPAAVELPPPEVGPRAEGETATKEPAGEREANG